MEPIHRVRKRLNLLLNLQEVGLRSAA